MSGLPRRRFHVPRISISVGFFAVFIILAGLLYSTLVTRPIGNRLTIVAVGNPHLVISWDRDNGTFFALSIPGDVSIPAVHGYGIYTLDALWKLDSIEKRGGRLYLESVSDALGIPIDGRIEAPIPELSSNPDPAKDVQAVSSIKSITSLLMHRMPSRSQIDLMRFLYALRNAGSDAITVVDISKPHYLEDVVRADQSTIQMINLGRLDATLAGRTEDPEIRNERLRVSILNATDMPGIGQKMSRLLTATGMFVVSVDNSRDAVSTCAVKATNDHLQTHTVRMITKLYGCTPVLLAEEENVDVTVIAGESVANKYRPYP